MKLSSRDNFYRFGAIEDTSVGVGVSTAARKYWRQMFQSQPHFLGTNAEINEVIAADYAAAEPIHRFKLKSGEQGEIRKSRSFYFVGVIRQGGRHDVIVIQPSWKFVKDDIRQERLKGPGI